MSMSKKVIALTLMLALLFSAAALFQSTSIATANPAPYPTTTPNTTPPTITVQSPHNNSIYNVTEVPLNFSIAKPSWDYLYTIRTISYILDGQNNTLWVNPADPSAADFNFSVVNGKPIKELSTVLEGIASGEHVLQINVHAQYQYWPDPNFYFPSHYQIYASQTILFTVNSASPSPSLEPTNIPNSEPFPTVPVVAVAGALAVVVVVAGLLVYFKKRKR
jgi:hypothetical protein